MGLFPHPGLVLAGCAIVVSTVANADWRDPIVGATPIRAARFEAGDGTLTVHARPHPSPKPASSDGEAASRHWSLPLVDRRLDAATRAAPVATGLLEAIARVEPIYDPTLLDGPLDIVQMRISAGTAEMRDLFGDHWRVSSADANVDAETRLLAMAWSATATPRPCTDYRVRRRHGWRDTALTAPTAADCRAMAAWQQRGFDDAAPLPVAIAAPPLPVFAAPEPGSRMSSADFWAARRAQVTDIHEHFKRKWASRGRAPLKAASN